MEITEVYSENRAKHIHTIRAKRNAELLLNNEVDDTLWYEELNISLKLISHNKVKLSL
jgi:hypothetical protein